MREYLKWLTVALALTAIISTDGCKKKEQINPPTVNVFEGAITIQFTSASVAAEVTDQGGADVKSRGFIYGLSGGSLDTVFCGSGVGVYSTQLNNLQPNTTYVYEAFAKNAGGTGTSGKVSFTTKPLPTYTISVSANPSDGGVVNGGGSFQEGQYCTVTATANEGYTFTNWTENDNEVSTDAYYTFMVNGNRTLKANFTTQLPNEYTISLSANPNNGGSVSGGGIYQEGQFCTVSAIANDGYAFANWTENGEEVSSDSNYTFTVNSNRTLVANFDVLPPNSYSINVTADPSYGGIVSGGGTYQQGQHCTVTATNNDNYSFSNWTENGNVVSTSANYTFTVNGNRTLVAYFTAIGTSNYTINVSASPSNGGTVTGGGIYEQGQSCTVQATANSGYTFANWTENDNEVSTNANYTFTVNSNRNLVAHFTVQGANTYTINVSANPNNGGTVAGGGTYEEGQSCEVRATANSGYTFVNWTENDAQVSANANYTFTVNGNRNLVANFTQQNTYTISAGVTPTGAGSVTGDGTYQQGQSCTLRATPAAGFTFQKWTKNGTQVSTNATYTFTVTESATFVAHFQLETYTIYASASPYSGGTVTGSGHYNYGENCTLGATAATGYTFVNWTKNGTQVSLNPTYTFPVTASGSYVAHFDMQPYNINLSANPSNGGTVSGGGIHYYGQSCTVHAVANSGYTFINWTENGSVVSTDADYTFTVTGSHTLVAHFSYILQYGSGTQGYVGGYLNGGHIEWAVSFPSSLIEPYDGYYITNIRCYFPETTTYTIKIYSGGTTSPNTLLLEQSVNIETADWYLISIPSLSLNANQSLWVTLSCDYEAGQRPVVGRPGINNPNSRWLYDENNGGWCDALTIGFIDIDMCWLCQVFLSSSSKTYSGLEKVLPQFDLDLIPLSSFKLVR